MSPRESQSGRGLWAIWFVIAALIALAAVPAYLGRRVAEVQTRITDVLGAAGSLSSRIELLKAQQMANFEAYLLTGDTAHRADYIADIAQEDSVFVTLSLLASDLDFDVREGLAQLRSESASWHLQNQLVFEASSRQGALEIARRGYDDLQRATRDLDSAIQSEVEEGRLALERVQTWQERLTVGLALLALGAAILVAIVGFRLRDLSDDAESGRSDAVRARHEVDLVLGATEDGVLGIDMEGRCTSLNRAGVELLGWPEREIMGRNVHDMVHHSWADGTPCPREASPILAALAKGAPLDSPDAAVLWNKEARAFPARWSLRPLVDESELRGAVLTFTDMTAIRDKESELRRAIEQRDEVVSIVSHDLRNPLGVVLAASDLLLELPLDEAERRRQAENIQRSGKRMQSLIEDLLDVARIEAGAFVVRTSLEELGPIVEEARALFADQAEDRGVGLRIAQGSSNPRARVDRDRILQAIANLLDNALRFTPQGGSVMMGVGENGTFVSLVVTDTGPGIEGDVLDHIFERFSGPRPARGGGAGLGLAIVKGVAEAHGGKVSVQTELGVGTSFVINLPRG